jgi:uncharacterized membrane protein|tara:strand:- start:714 stop:881 length:168 start_codon:yes stop_codon:yes gene_type:complete
MEIIAQIFGMTLVGIIILCLVSTVMGYIFTSASRDRNRKLLENMENFDKNKKYEI